MQYATAVPGTLSTEALETPALDKSGRLLFRLASAILLLNLLDAVLTLALVTSGLAIEANPVMAEVIGRGAVHFMAYKMALVSLCVLLCWRLRENRVACVAIYGTAVTYALLGLYHIQSIGALARYLS